MSQPSLLITFACVLLSCSSVDARVTAFESVQSSSTESSASKTVESPKAATGAPAQGPQASKTKTPEDTSKTKHSVAQSKPAVKKKTTEQAQNLENSAEALQPHVSLFFGDITSLCTAAGCPDASDLDAYVLGTEAGNESPIPATLQEVGGNQVLVQYSSRASFKPTKLMLIRKSTKGDVSRKTAVMDLQGTGDLKPRKATLSGDFHDGSTCTSGYLSDTSLNSVPVSLIGKPLPRTTTIEYSASDNFIPDTFTLLCGDRSPITVPFIIFRGLHTSTIGFASNDIDDQFCGKPCKDLKSEDVSISLEPSDPDAQAILLTITAGRIWAQVSSLPEYAPSTVLLKINASNKVTYAKRLLGPVTDNHQPFLTYTVMDSETEKRNFGRRIAFNYFAVNVQVHNPTEQNIQLNKARLWFDCDYAAIPPKKLYSNSKYVTSGDPPLAHKYFFGVDHTQKQFPSTLMQVLNSFDAQTGIEKTIFDGADLSGAVLSALTGLVNDNQYAVAVNIFTGILAPSVRRIIMNPDEMTTKRNSLIVQSLDSVIQAPAKKAASTLVFLPRKGILGWLDTNGQAEQIPVVIDLIRDLHFEPEIVLNLTPPQNQVITAGLTEDEVQKILGAPTTRTENNGALVYTYATGNYKEVDFKKDSSGIYRVSDMKERTPQEQIVVGQTTAADAIKILGGSSADLQDTVDGGKLWLNAPLMKSNLLFGSNNVLKDSKYQDAHSTIQGMKGKTFKEITGKAADLATLDAATKKAIQDAASKGPQKGLLQFPSPDLAHETINLQGDTAATIDSVVNIIFFTQH
jgi:hypothetical protein